MDRKKFIERIRRGSASFRVDDVTVCFADGEISGSGELEFSHDHFSLDLLLPEGVIAPDMRSGVLTKKDFGSLQGVIDHDLPFRIKNLPPHHEHSESNGRSTLRYDLDAIELSPIGSDKQTYDQIRLSLEQLESFELAEQTTSESARLEDDEASDVTFSGVLRGFKLIARNAGTRIERHNDFLGSTSSIRSDTQCGDLSVDWEYGLIESSEDVEFHLRLKSGCKSSDPKQDLETLHAFLEAIAFIHGQHAWPFTLQFRRDGKLITDRVRAPKVPKRSPHKPFNERIWFNARIGKIDWDFGLALQKAYNLFRSQTPLSDEVSKLLFLSREAAGGEAHTTISNIALCSLLDSAVNLVFEQRIEPQLTRIIGTFESVRSELLSFISEKTANVADATEEPWQRFYAIIKSSEFYAAKEKFRRVGDHLGLNWEDDWHEIFRFWAKWRPRLVHRGTGRESEDKAVQAEFNVGSRVIGAIHILVLKLMGYEGFMVSSTFEDQVRRV
jgi:hypothetical protein